MAAEPMFLDGEPLIRDAPVICEAVPCCPGDEGCAGLVADYDYIQIGNPCVWRFVSQSTPSDGAHIISWLWFYVDETGNFATASGEVVELELLPVSSQYVLLKVEDSRGCRGEVYKLAACTNCNVPGFIEGTDVICNNPPMIGVRSPFILGGDPGPWEPPLSVVAMLSLYVDTPQSSSQICQCDGDVNGSYNLGMSKLDCNGVDYSGIFKGVWSCKPDHILRITANFHVVRQNGPGFNGGCIWFFRSSIRTVASATGFGTEIGRWDADFPPSTHPVNWSDTDTVNHCNYPGRPPADAQRNCDVFI